MLIIVLLYMISSKELQSADRPNGTLTMYAVNNNYNITLHVVKILAITVNILTLGVDIQTNQMAQN